MIKKIIRNARYIFIAFMVMILIGVAINYNHNGPVNTMFILGECTAGALMLSLLLGSINYYRFEVLLPKTRESLLDKSPFKELRDNGFEENDGRLIKIIEGYSVYVSSQIEPQMIMVEVLFNPINNGVDYTKEELYQLTKPYDKATWFRNKSYWWGKGVLINQISYAFKMPDYEMVKGKIDQCIEILKTNGVKP